VVEEEWDLCIDELLDNPGTAAFSRIKYLQRLGTEEQAREFLNGLFLAALEGKYRGDWDSLIEFLECWEDVAIGAQFRTLAIPDVDIPWATLGKPLDRARVALVTTGGVYVEGQKPFERGDVTYRELPAATPGDQLRIWHPGYDIGPATEDINCIYPVDRFAEMESEGVIGELASTGYSFMGLIDDTDALSNETAPKVARRLRDEGVDAVFLAST
jgi:D-proline reductase (dithiol) PrdB